MIIARAGAADGRVRYWPALLHNRDAHCHKCAGLQRSELMAAELLRVAADVQDRPDRQRKLNAGKPQPVARRALSGSCA